jgi:hypothetical protein
MLPLQEGIRRIFQSKTYEQPAVRTLLREFLLIFLNGTEMKLKNKTRHYSFVFIVALTMLSISCRESDNDDLIAIGKSYEGGIIFKIDGTGQHGLVYSPDLYMGFCPWGCCGTRITGADGTAVGTGNQNTMSIEIECAETNTAAHYCATLEIDGYTGWYLPSKDELKLIYENLKEANFLSRFYKRNYEGSLIFYWSSTEVSDSLAWCQEFEYGYGIKDPGNSLPGCQKFCFLEVCAIRAF